MIRSEKMRARGNRSALVAFLVAYLAVFAVVLAPKGFFAATAAPHLAITKLSGL
ncbi:MAG: hypothetical protein K0B00_14050 [Rhodobacteraceae bacterium]|nr:hypothetical protein [Paracoccaceae bacterium]